MFKIKITAFVNNMISVIFLYQIVSTQRKSYIYVRTYFSIVSNTTETTVKSTNKSTYRQLATERSTATTSKRYIGLTTPATKEISRFIYSTMLTIEHSSTSKTSTRTHTSKPLPTTDNRGAGRHTPSTTTSQSLHITDDRETGKQTTSKTTSQSLRTTDNQESGIYNSITTSQSHTG